MKRNSEADSGFRFFCGVRRTAYARVEDGVYAADRTGDRMDGVRKVEGRNFLIFWGEGCFFFIVV
jgi:hypothetical protein